MKFGFSLIVRGNDATLDTFAAVAERAEALQLDSLWLSAHVIVPPQVKSGYVMVPGLKHPEHWKEAYWEPFTVMSYLSAITTTVQLGTSIVVLPMHNPIEVAKQVAEVDQLSGGRFIFGVGVGWFEEEFEALGQNYANRGARTDDALQLMKHLWADDPVTYNGDFYSVTDCCFSPKPKQLPHPPIWIAGASRPAYRRAARFGDVFHPARMPVEKVVAAKAEIAEFCEHYGRARDAVGIAMKTPIVFKDGPPVQGEFATQGRVHDIIDGINRYLEIGTEHFVLDVVPEKLDHALDTMERFAQEVRPKLG